MKTPQLPLRYHPLHSPLPSIVTSTCLMDQQHFHKAQCKAEASLLVSMRRRQQRLETTMTGPPSFDVLWQSLRLQLMETLQRLASERQLTLIEAKEMMLWTKPQDLLMDKR